MVLVYSGFGLSLIYLIYLFSLFMFANSSTLMMSWILLEINAISFITLMSKLWESKSSMLYYLLVQTFGSFIFLFYVINANDSAFSPYLFVLSVIIKLGFFPFHSWFYKLSSYVSMLTFYLILTIQKLPGFVLLYFNFSSNLFMFMLLNVIFGCLFLFSCRKFEGLMVSSSLYMGYWNYVLYILSPFFFFFFYVIYSLSVYIGMKLIKGNSYVKMGFGMMGLLFLLSFLMGLPPFSVFFLKFYLISIFNQFFSDLHLIIIWLASFLCMMGYFKFFLKNLLYSPYLMSCPVPGFNFLLPLFFLFSCGVCVIF